ncbi:chorismate synthase [Candidatus Hydrogenisulfobacillus filiaventi]|uniref:Chorismate synthase n=1 Tax=Candidatus Hydrogenisulfobacillus filiaventi TaxID=2707344 RepID=A0A6F8ZH03_9FIRM|nr:chorismate synthase [Bacillota bacterium]CAB1128928.1 chorismate synthase [Candidatus Hydrogenisulfobacillus filiaventi]
MQAWRWLTAGESHGPGLVGIVEGVPAGVPLGPADIDRDLARRQQGYGRGGRMRIEQDRVTIWGGVRHGRTLGSPVALLVANKDHEHWRTTMAVEPVAEVDRVVTRPRPGHADLAGGIKYGHRDLRNVLERASARETTMRVALGAVARAFLSALGITVRGHVLSLGAVEAPARAYTLEELERAETSPVRVVDPAAEEAMMAEVDRAKAAGDTLGGVFEVDAFGLPVGLGSYVQWDRRLEAALGAALLSIPAIKGVEVGTGFRQSAEPGSAVHDPIRWEAGTGFTRPTNRAGGLEGGITTGQPLVVRIAMKPLSTLMKPLESVDIESKQPFLAQVERSDVTAVPAAVVVGEAMVLHVLADAVLQKFGGDSLEEVRERVEAWDQRVRRF